MAPPDPRGRIASALATKLALARLAGAFASHNLPLMPLKGAALVHLFGRDPVERPVSDVDVLVPRHRFDEATELAGTLGWTFSKEEPDGRQRLFLSDSAPPLDLHATPFLEGQFRLDTADLFARASVDDTTFGARVYVPSPPDLYAHLVGHLAFTWLFEHRVHHVDDLAFVARTAGLEPGATAHHLRRCGMAFAARYALELAVRDGDTFASEVLRHLGHEKLHRLWARPLLAGVARLPLRSGLGLVPANVLHRAPWHGARVVVRGIMKRIGRARAVFTVTRR